MTENTSQPAAEFKADFNDLNYFKNIYHQEYIRTAHQSGKISQSERRRSTGCRRKGHAPHRSL